MTKRTKAPGPKKNISPGGAPGKKKRRTIADLADEHQALWDRWDVLEAQQKLIEADADKLALEAKSMMESSGVEKGSTHGVDFELKEREHFNIKDFKALWDWCVKTKNFVFQKRVGSEMFRDLRDAGVKVPGVEVFRPKVFQTKRRKKRGR